MQWPDVTAFDVESVWENACRILEGAGLVVLNPSIRERLAGMLPCEGGRIRLPRGLMRRCLGEIRDRSGAEPSPSPGTPITIGNSDLNVSYLDPRTDENRPYETATVVQHAKLAFQLTEEGLLAGGVTGVPQDVPPRLQFVAGAYLDAVYNPRPSSHTLALDPEQFSFLLEIADLFGLPHVLCTEMISPLRFAGGSVDIAFEWLDRGHEIMVGVDPMPMLGVTAPADWHMGWAQSVAENLGSYIIFREAGFERVALPSFRLFVPNMRVGTIYFSSPKHLTALLTRRKVREFFGLATSSAELMLVTAKRADAQAAAEKMAGAMLGKLYGFAHLEGAGGLWLDEIFSPVQLIIDLEIRNYVNSLDPQLAGSAEDVLEVMERGLTGGGFLDDPLTLDAFEDYIWRPGLFDLSPRGGWTGPSVHERARDIAEARAAQYSYELTDERREELERIMVRARRALT
ncbi:MAG: trimethylamine methyltransferase family protein [Planctomycetota bacterium]|jgi:trimethylamine:corrinoid methyltransferase-like protein